MHVRDQIKFKIRKLARAIKAVGDLPTKPSRVRFLTELEQDRKELLLAWRQSPPKRPQDAPGTVGKSFTPTSSTRYV